MKNSEERITLFDRIGAGILSALSAFVTLGILLLFVIYTTQGDYGLVGLKVFSAVVVFFFVLGFITLDNYFISILDPIWKLIGELFK